MRIKWYGVNYDVMMSDSILILFETHFKFFILYDTIKNLIMFQDTTFPRPEPEDWQEPDERDLNKIKKIYHYYVSELVKEKDK